MGCLCTYVRMSLHLPHSQTAWSPLLERMKLPSPLYQTLPEQLPMGNTKKSKNISAYIHTYVRTFHANDPKCTKHTFLRNTEPLRLNGRTQITNDLLTEASDGVGEKHICSSQGGCHYNCAVCETVHVPPGPSGWVQTGVQCHRL